MFFLSLYRENTTISSRYDAIIQFALEIRQGSSVEHAVVPATPLLRAVQSFTLGYRVCRRRGGGMGTCWLKGTKIQFYKMNKLWRFDV